MLNKQPLLTLIKSSNQDYNNHKTVRKLEDICKIEASRVSPIPLYNTPALNHSGSNSSLYLVFCSADCHLLKSLQLPWAQCVPLPTARRRQPALCPASGTSTLVWFESWSWVCAGVSAWTLAAHSRWDEDTDYYHVETGGARQISNWPSSHWFREKPN